MAQKKANEKLLEWQRKFNHNKTRYEDALSRMEEREELYRGGRKLKPLTEKDTGKNGSLQTPHVRNIIAENIESQVNSNLPMPKVTARRKKDEHLAKLIEDMEAGRIPKRCNVLYDTMGARPSVEVTDEETIKQIFELLCEIEVVGPSEWSITDCYHHVFFELQDGTIVGFRFEGEELLVGSETNY
jgi:hypothetical protein